MNALAPTNPTNFVAVFQSFFAFFERIYQVGIPPAARQPIEAEMLRGLSNPDRTVVDLITYVIQTDRILVSTRDPLSVANLVARARQILQREFINPEPNDRGRVLAAIHQMLEQLSAGCTGVALAAVVAAPNAMPSPYPQAGAQPGPAGQPGASPLPQAQQERFAIDARQQQMAMQLYRHNAEHQSIMKMF
jgi:hypothetical protein